MTNTKKAFAAASFFVLSIAIPYNALAAEFKVSACTVDGVSEEITFISDDNVKPKEGVNPQKIIQDFWTDYISSTTWLGLASGAASEKWKTGLNKMEETLGADFLIEKTEPIIGSCPK